MATEKLTQNFFERHGGKIEFGSPSGCWLWSAAMDGAGYGSVGARGKVRSAHREAFEAEHGENSAVGLVVRHRCDTPLCVNPSHLELGTVADNNRDRDERGRHVALKGENHGLSKLTKADVLSIRAEYVHGSREFGQCALARRFGVAQSLISQTVHRKTWKHI